MLICPVCGKDLEYDEQGAHCGSGHRFDRAREGYLNLLRSNRAGDTMGDPKSQARSRRDFLNRGYYAPLRDTLVDLVASRMHGVGKAPYTLLDICCGEGYYTSALGAVDGIEAYGFDLGKEMVRLAAKRRGATYFVANMKAIPVRDASFDMATHLFAPFNERELARVVKPGGTLLSVIPGARHLWGLKETLYDTPYENDERLPETTRFELMGTRKVDAQIALASSEDIEAVFQMTPYYYRTRPQDKARLEALETLETPIEFVIGEYRRL